MTENSCSSASVKKVLEKSRHKPRRRRRGRSRANAHAARDELNQQRRVTKTCNKGKYLFGR
eukprot:UN10142